MQQQRLALPAASAQGCGAASTASPRQCQGQVKADPRTGHSERVAHGDRAAVDVDPGRVHTEVPDAADTERRDPQERIFYKGRWYEGLYLSAGASAES